VTPDYRMVLVEERAGVPPNIKLDGIYKFVDQLQKLAVLLLVLAFAGGSQALKCYACMPNKPIQGIKLMAALDTALKAFPLCSNFEESQKFTQECPVLANQGCMKAVDPKDENNVLRSCFLRTKDECDGKGLCECTGDLCNAAGHGWPSVAVLLSALAVALLGSR